MSSTEQQIKNIIARYHGRAHRQQIARELKISLAYIDFICSGLKRKGGFLKIIPKEQETSVKKNLPKRKRSATDLSLSNIPGLNKSLIKIVEKAGYKEVESLAQARIAKLVQETNLKLSQAAQLINKARGWLSKKSTLRKIRSTQQKAICLILMFTLILFALAWVVLAKGEARYYGAVDLEPNNPMRERLNLPTETTEKVDSERIAPGEPPEATLSLNNHLENKITDGLATAKYAGLPRSSQREIKKVMKVMVVVTFYSSDHRETDDTPFITAQGTLVHDGVAASNFLRFGTLIKLPELYGDKVFTIEDRMNPRFSDRVDIWVETREKAVKGGIHYTTLEIY